VDKLAAEKCFSFPEYSVYLSQQTPAPSCARSNQAAASATIQINAHLDKPIVPFNSLTNPLQFWQNEPNRELKELAFKYLIITATSVPSERTASAAGNTLSDHRTKITPEHANELVFLNKNLYLLDL